MAEMRKRHKNLPPDAKDRRIAELEELLQKQQKQNKPAQQAGASDGLVCDFPGSHRKCVGTLHKYEYGFQQIKSRQGT
jgi:hypothetical protein